VIDGGEGTGKREACHAFRSRRYNGRVITLNENEERLVEAFRTLPADTADQVIRWTTRLRDLAKGRCVEWSDTWSDEDLADARRAALSSFDEREQAGD
jgi:hypothetical protein